AEDRLIVLPEMFDVGFSMNVAATAQTPARESEAFARALARRHQSTVLAGVVGPCSGQQASNEAVAFDPHGDELVRYRKLQPFTPAGEDQHYGHGDSHRQFKLGGFAVTPFICYDLRFPEHFRRAAGDGSNLFIVIACWPARRSEHWARLLQARAIENQSFVLGVNRCGSDPALQYDGRSMLIDPLGTILFEADAREQVLTASIDVTTVDEWRTQFPALRDMGPI
ncbi:MAG: hypothetical protein KDB23_33540, partial [Planctomycetales bacterium]|nr:hypothetical protein [Planctomycetales bacterium]